MSKDNKSNVVYLSDYRRKEELAPWATTVEPGRGLINSSQWHDDNATGLGAERWLFVNRVPMKVRETEECTEFAFETHEGVEITMAIGSDDTTAFVAKIDATTVIDIEPGPIDSIENVFCSFYIDGNISPEAMLVVYKPGWKEKAVGKEEEKP